MSQLGSADKSLVPQEQLVVLKVPSFISKGFDWFEFGRWLIWWEFWLYLCIPGGEWWRDGVGLAPRHFSPPPIRFWDRRKPASNWDNWTQSDWSGDRSPSVRWHLITAQATTLLLLGFIFFAVPHSSSSSSGVVVTSQVLKGHINSQSIYSQKICHLRWM